METIRDIETQIQAHKRAKEFHHEKYLNNLQIIDDKIERIEKQMEKSKSSVKRDLLKRHIDWYEGEISRMDVTYLLFYNLGNSLDLLFYQGLIITFCHDSNVWLCT